MAVPVDIDKVTPRGRALAATLRRLRERAGVGSRDLSTRLGLSHSAVSHWEHGRRIPNPDDVAAVLDALGVTGEERDRVLDLARRANEPSWLAVGLPGVPRQLAAVIESERAAVAIAQWVPFGVPGLLQTPEYARAQFEAAGLAPHEVETRGYVRVSRREVLTREPFPVRYRVLVGEAALREPVGPPPVMAGQLRFLAEFADRPNVDLRIVPLRVGWHPGHAGPFVLYEFADTDPVLYFEHYGSGVFVPDAHDVAVHCAAIDTMSALALRPAESIRFLDEVAGEWGRE